MFDDLFGDLPTAKKGGGGVSSNNSTKTESSDSNTKTANSSIQSKNPTDSTAATSSSLYMLPSSFQNPAKTSSVVSNPRFSFASGNKSTTTTTTTDNNTTNSSNNKTNNGLSLVGALGNAGTTVAFLPAALTSRKRPTTTTTSGSSGGGGGGGGSSTGVTSDPRGNHSIVSKDASVSIERSKRSRVVREVVVPGGSSTTTTTTTSENETAQLDSTTDNNESSESSPNAVTILTTTTTTKNESQNPEHETPKTVTDDEYTEPQSLRNLHASVTPQNAYDPLIPNDYLAYRRHKENLIIKEGLQRQVKKTLEMQEKLRNQITEERKRAEASGDVEKIIESRSGSGGGGGGGGGGVGREGVGMGRGRGRGTTNLPAWLVKKQMEERRQKEEQKSKDVDNDGDGVGVGDGKGSNGDSDRFEDASTNHSETKPETKTITTTTTTTTTPTTLSSNQPPRRNDGRTVLLADMVSPSEADDPDLTHEVREECELRCGPVELVEVEVGGPLSPITSNSEKISDETTVVRVYVTFQKAECARIAAETFDGRMFGERMIRSRLLL